MSAVDRRTFLRTSLGATAAGAMFGGPFQGLVARLAAAAEGEFPIAARNGGYGPLVPIRDKRDGVVRLHLPRGFQYRSFSVTGEVMNDGVMVPGRHDGMASFRGPRGTVRLVRNHEINGPVGAFGDHAKAYDRMTGGGTSTLEVSPHAERVRAWVSINGTQMNCAGGETPWGSWVTCEETVNGPDVGPDFTGAPNTSLEQQHGYVFEVPSSWGPGEHRRVAPIRNAGRFAHEAVATDPVTGFLYQTEDNFGFPSGFYRYRAPVHPNRAGGYVDGGVLEALAIAGSPGAQLHTGQSVGVVYDVNWVTIDEPDTTFPDGTTNDEAIVFVGDQGRAKGAATFSRLEGLFYDNRKMYIVSTQGGDGEGGATSGFGRGAGQVWVYDLDAATLTLLFESPHRDVLELPDNCAIGPKGSVLLCEDGPIENYLRGVTPRGEIFDFGLNALEGREREEFAGVTFSPKANVMFVNLQAASGLTYAIWGPFAKGVL